MAPLSSEVDGQLLQGVFTLTVQDAQKAPVSTHNGYTRWLYSVVVTGG